MFIFINAFLIGAISGLRALIGLAAVSGEGRNFVSDREAHHSGPKLVDGSRSLIAKPGRKLGAFKVLIPPPEHLCEIQADGGDFDAYLTGAWLPHFDVFYPKHFRRTEFVETNYLIDEICHNYFALPSGSLEPELRASLTLHFAALLCSSGLQ